VFGSIARGQATAASDVDILIVNNHIPNTCKERGNLKAKIEEEAGLPPIPNTLGNRRGNKK